MEENPSTTAGTINIMSRLHKYVPMMPDGKTPYTIPTHGDCMAVERMIDGKIARLADMTLAEQISGLEPTPQEFHHRGNMLQVPHDNQFIHELRV
jgi:hypothetical protein